MTKTGLFEKPFKYKNTSATPLYDGDILVTRTKGHTAAVVEGNDRPDKVKALQEVKTETKPVAKESAKTTTAKSSAEVEAALHRNNLYTGTYRCSTNLNLRTGAGTNKKLLLTIPSGSAVYCYGYYNTANNHPWLLITVKLNGKTYTGYVSKTYLIKI